MGIKTSRFGVLNVASEHIIHLSEGMMGFEKLKQYFIVDPSDETMILWFQSVENSEIAFPILEPMVFRKDYHVRLSANELRVLKLSSLEKEKTLVYSVLTIPADVREMTANLKAPIVVNTKERLGRQVVLQENEYSVKCAMYNELSALVISVAKTPMGTIHRTNVATAVPLAGVESGVQVSPL